MRVAILHEWFVTYAGSERVVEHLLNVYPDADLFALVDFLEPHERKFIKNKRCTTSFIQHLPLAKRLFRMYLPIFPFAVDQFDFSDYDVVISSSHAVAKGAASSADQLHICYCHTPMRYVWDMKTDYVKAGSKRSLGAFVKKYLLYRLKKWDILSSHNVDYFVANSKYIKRRIRKSYRAESTVIYPPVDTEKFSVCNRKEEFFLVVSRLVPYKKVDVVVSAFRRMPNHRLVVIGDGPGAESLREGAGTANIEFLGYQPDEVVVDYMRRAKAFVFAALEDFGITVVEAQACGTPVIAFGKGGACETVLGLGETRHPTGLFFQRQDEESIMAAVCNFEAHRDAFSPMACRRNAERFSVDLFRRNIRDFVSQCWRSQQLAAATKSTPIVAAATPYSDTPSSGDDCPVPAGTAAAHR